jgi:alpha-1,3/alpha-1,6-mannosyltransferase
VIALLYTPPNEHFGIVPLEVSCLLFPLSLTTSSLQAMSLGTPVIAVNNGGPLETVLHNVTGYLCEEVLSLPPSFFLFLTSSPDS